MPGTAPRNKAEAIIFPHSRVPRRSYLIFVYGRRISRQLSAKTSDSAAAFHFQIPAKQMILQSLTARAALEFHLLLLS
jgi:hypothetical protein